MWRSSRCRSIISLLPESFIVYIVFRIDSVVDVTSNPWPWAPSSSPKMLIKDISNIDLMTIKKYTWKPRKQKEQLRKRTLTRKTNLYGIQNNIIHKISTSWLYLYIVSISIYLVGISSTLWRPIPLSKSLSDSVEHLVGMEFRSCGPHCHPVDFQQTSRCHSIGHWHRRKTFLLRLDSEHT